MGVAMRTRVVCAAVLGLLVGVVGLATTTRSAAAAPGVLSAFGTPSLDGVEAPGEWNPAARVDFQLKPSLAPASFLVMNDATNLYVAFRLSGPPSPGWAGVSANFDNDGDGVNSEGDEAIVVNAWQGSFRELYDEYYTTKPPCTASACLGIEDFRTGGTTDSRAASSYAGSATFFEIAQPLNSADNAHDLNLTTGDLIAVMPTTEVSWCDGSTCTHTGVSETPLRIVIAPFAAPMITAVAPTRAAHGTSVTISGDHLAGATAVTFGGVAATFELKTNRELVAIVPAGVGSGLVTSQLPAVQAQARRPSPLWSGHQ
jgi:hypothetical protein